MASNYGTLPFAEQITFFRRKLNLPTATWRDIWQAQHDTTFVVAGANRAALVEDFRAALDKAVSQGTTLAEFRQDFDRIVATHGWSYNGGRGWRSRVIYDTNLRTSYAAGRLQQMKAISDRRPYWRYRHSIGVAHPRAQHLAWDGRILRHDDPWWDVHYPPNSWGCRCYVETLAERDMKRLGKAGPDAAPTPANDTTGIGEGWAYTPGRSRLRALTAEPLDQWPTAALIPSLLATDALPPVRTLAADYRQPSDLPAQDYVDAFLAEFGALGQDGAWQDVLGETLFINDQLFRDARGQLKISKRARQAYVRMLARTIIEPDEIWVILEPYRNQPGRYLLRRRYLARWRIEGEQAPGLAVFDIGTPGWTGVTTFAPQDEAYLKGQRRGVRLYRRNEEGED